MLTALCVGCLMFSAPAFGDPSATPKTSLIGLTMPPGSQPLSTGWCSNCTYPHEEWKSATGVASTVATIRAQLPAGAALQGVPWCKQDDTALNMPMWMWAGGPNTSEIDIGVDDLGDGYGHLTIEMPSGSRVLGCHR